MIERALRSSVAWGTVAMGLRMLSAVILLPLATLSLDSSMLGMWYVFTSILGFTSVLDAGMTAILGRRFARRITILRKDPLPIGARTLLGTSRAILTGTAALTLLILGLGGGWWVWERSASLGHSLAIRWAYALMLPSFVLGTVSNAGRILLFGANRLNIFQMSAALAFLVQFLVSAGGLLMGFGLFALVVGNVAYFAALACALPAALYLEPKLRRHVFQPLPVDMRMGCQLYRISFGTFLNTLSNYMALNATVLIASRFLSLAETASYGLTLQVLLLLAQASAIWVDLKQPLFSPLYREDRQALHRLFAGRMRICIGIFLGCLLGLLLLGNPLLTLIGAKTHFMPAAPTLLLAALVLGMTHQTLNEFLCLCLGKNPFSRMLLTTGITSLVASATLAHFFGLWGLLVGAALPQLLVPQWRIPQRALREIGLNPGAYFKLIAGIK